MLLKVFKHFFKKNIKILLPIDIAICVAAILFSVTTLSTTSGYGFGILNVFTTLIIVFSELAVIAGIVAGFILIFIRFCKDMCTDEAYLTYTLPIEAKDQIMGRFWAVLLLETINIAFALVGFSSLLIFQPELAPEFFSFIGTALKTVFTSGGFAVLLFFEVLLYILILEVASIFLMFAIALLIGVVVKRKKALVIIGLYVAFETLAIIFITVTISVIERIALSTNFTLASIQPFAIVMILIAAASVVGLYFANVLMVRHKINLS